MPRVSYLRPAGTAGPPGLLRVRHRSTGPTALRGRRPRARYLLGAALLVTLLALGAAAVVVYSAQPSLSPDSDALARIEMPPGGGTVERISVSTGPHSRRVPVRVQGGKIWPTQLIAAHQRVTVEAVIKRPGAIGWLTGSTQRLRLELITPSTSLRDHYLTLRSGEPVVLRFKDPVRALAYGAPGHLVRRVLTRPLTEIRLHRNGLAGTIAVAAAPRSWETSASASVSWFPDGAAATAVSDPAPGSQIMPLTKLTLTFSKPVAQALHSVRPVITPATAGSWQVLSSHTITFTPRGYGYGLGAKVTLALPSGVRMVGAGQTGTGSSATWQVPRGSPLRLQQLLAQLGYLPLNFTPQAQVGSNVAAQETAAIHPPVGSFGWRWGDIPSALRSFWSPGSSGVMTQGALIAFQSDHGLSTDGIAGAAVWRKLFDAAATGRASRSGYSFVSVSVSGQSLSLWHSGRTIMSAPVNTGIAAAPTATGTFPVYEHLRVTTMSGTNPDGSHYNDPGIQFVSYFNGGDALHAFTRAQYGSPQSLGCVEMALDPAGQVWPYTPLGTLVHVA